MKTLPKLVLAAAATLSLAASAKADTPTATTATPLNCDSQPGAQVCQDIRLVQSWYVTCDGDTCYQVWREQMEGLDGLTDNYLRNVPIAIVTDDTLADMARSLADTICRSEATGDPDWINRLALSENRALDALKSIQDANAAGVATYCQKTVQDQ